MLRTRKLVTAIWLLAAVALAAGAMPAFTADNGTINGTVSATAAPAPCIQLSTTSLDFGTLAFAANGTASRGESPGVTFANCSTAVSSFAIAGTDATGSSATWTLTDSWLNCDSRTNRYGLFWGELPERFSGDYLTTTPRTLSHHRPPANDLVETFNPAESETDFFQISMPCTGSAGTGQAFTFSIALTATVA